MSGIAALTLFWVAISFLEARLRHFEAGFYRDSKMIMSIKNAQDGMSAVDKVQLDVYTQMGYASFMSFLELVGSTNDSTQATLARRYLRVCKHFIFLDKIIFWTPLILTIAFIANRITGSFNGYLYIEDLTTIVIVSLLAAYSVAFKYIMAEIDALEKKHAHNMFCRSKSICKFLNSRSSVY